MLRDMAWQTADLMSELAQLLPERRIFAAGKTGKVLQLVRQSVRPAVRQFCDELDLAQWQVECLADFAHSRPQAVGWERAHEARMLGAIACVHAADQLLTDLAREIEIDVGHRRERLVQKATQKQPVGDRIDMGQAEEIADDGGDRGAASPAGQQVTVGASRAAPNVGCDVARQVEKVMINKKETAELVMLDEPQFFVEPAHGLGVLERTRRGALLHPRAAPLGPRLPGRSALG